MAAPTPSKMDERQILQGVYDEANGRLRVDSVSTILSADIDVALDSTEDNVAIRDSAGHELNINPDGSINAIVTGNLDIEISAADGDNIAISDGTDFLAINPDGSINVVVGGSAGTLNTSYTEVTGVVSGITTLIGTHTAVANTLLQKIEFSGTNIAEYELVINGNTQDKKRTYFGNSLNSKFDFNNGLIIPTGQVIQVYVVHDRPEIGDFNARIQTLVS